MCLCFELVHFYIKNHINQHLHLLMTWYLCLHTFKGKFHVTGKAPKKLMKPSYDVSTTHISRYVGLTETPVSLSTEIWSTRIRQWPKQLYQQLLKASTSTYNHPWYVCSELPSSSAPAVFKREKEKVRVNKFRWYWGIWI